MEAYIYAITLRKREADAGTDEPVYCYCTYTALSEAKRLVAVQAVAKDHTVRRSATQHTLPDPATDWREYDRALTATGEAETDWVPIP